jgi:hypothetical protein
MLDRLPVEILRMVIQDVGSSISSPPSTVSTRQVLTELGGTTHERPYKLIAGFKKVSIGYWYL